MLQWTRTQIIILNLHTSKFWKVLASSINSLVAHRLDLTLWVRVASKLTMAAVWKTIWTFERSISKSSSKMAIFFLEQSPHMSATLDRKPGFSCFSRSNIWKILGSRFWSHFPVLNIGKCFKSSSTKKFLVFQFYFTNCLRTPN